ncbi:Hypothetical predicted protein [Mytilus galloprovincialis]|uniref:Uncharacterized protein n=1 Tax=Mytilus galloprovincialis TaxID=29158 RepID=A0A8B6FV12_MYTGA|nr:Hypothetical predicted protein [Mytilus galloprovincialis]
MEPEIEAICKQMSKDCFKRLLDDMQGIPGEFFYPEMDISNQNKTNMASYSEVLSNTNQNKAVGADNVTGIQRIPDMWRIYMDNEEDKLSLLVTGMNLRGRKVSLHSQNPRNPGRITVKNVPISADDGQIHRALTLQGSP